jgi:RNA polymerase sigma-70 factor (ECF subfamily)
VRISQAPPAAEPVNARPDLAAIYDAQFDGVWRYLRRLGVREADVEDVVHDVFVVAHRRIDSYDPSRPLRPWLLGIAFRVAAERRRADHREVIDPEPGLELADAAPWPDQVLEAREARRRVEAALDELGIAQRAVFVLHDLESLSAPEIAQALEVPLNTVYSRLRLARAKVAISLRGAP